jgi:hypothetical protein
VRVVCVADSDSYVKWGAGLLGQLPPGWERELLVVETPVTPSAPQLASALAGTGFAGLDVPVVPLAAVRASLRTRQADVVVLALRGPVVRVVMREIVGRTPPGGARPLFVSGVPGITYPPTLKALVYRSQADLMVLHSKREIQSFDAMAAANGIQQRFGLTTLPFLTRAPAAASGDLIVFAAQAKVPAEREERIRVLEALRELALRQPHRRVVVKLRAVSGERQTHAEQFPYDELLAELADVPLNLTVEAGPMATYLANASALVTVSSTAAVESAAMRIPTLVLDDFGVSQAMINLVFEHSGLMGNLDDLANGRFRLADSYWLDENYVHDAVQNDWVTLLETALAERATRMPQLRALAGGGRGGRVRFAWDRKRAFGPLDRTPSGYLALAIGRPFYLLLRAAQKAAKSFREEPPADEVEALSGSHAQPSGHHEGMTTR